MEKPEVFKAEPAHLHLEAGNYFWCQCGRSKNNPFCDGSHRGTAFRALKFTLAQKQEVWLCQCKQTKTPPFCDGSHTSV